MTRRLLIPAVAVGGLFLAGLGLGATGGGPTKLTAKLDARQEVPAAKGAAGASGRFAGTLSGRTLTWRLTFSRLSGPAAAAHVHLGPLGVAGPVAVPLCGPCRSGAQGKAVVGAKVAAALRGGGAYYVNVHTKRNPGGEIRGQIGGGKAAPAADQGGAGTTTGGYDDPSYGYG